MKDKYEELFEKMDTFSEARQSTKIAKAGLKEIKKLRKEAKNLKRKISKFSGNLSKEVMKLDTKEEDWIGSIRDVAFDLADIDATDEDSAEELLTQIEEILWSIE